MMESEITKISDACKEKIDFVKANSLSSFNQRILEKDILVTQAIKAISQVSIPGVQAVFCGGTCLSKAYGIIRRMSEDVDFKLVCDLNATKSRKRKLLGELKHSVMECLKEGGFGDVPVRARNENTFFRFEIPYESVFEAVSSLRPYLKIECIHMPIQLNPVTNKLSSMVDQCLLEEKEQFSVPCQAIEEILVEKVIAVLRRLSDDRESYSEAPYLMRHVYDVAEIVKHGIDKNVDLEKLFQGKIETEQMLFKGHCGEFADDPYAAFSASLEDLEKNLKREKDYQEVIFPMIMDEAKVDYRQALALFNSVAEDLVESLDNGKSPGY